MRQMPMKTMSLIAATVASAFTISTAQAAVVQAVSTESASSWGGTHSGTIQAIAGDLLETSISGVNDSTTSPHDASQHNVPSLTDGSINTGWNTPAGVYGSDGGGDSIEYVLDTSVNTLGYDISQIVIIQLSGDTNNRPFANVDIEFGYVGGGTAAIHSTGQVGGGSPQDVNKVDLTDDGGLLGTGVESVKFTFLGSGGNLDDWTWYRELDVVGVATVPEPGSLALLGLCGLLIARRRRG